MPMDHPRLLARRLVTASLLCVAAACGGSGSSGLDIVAAERDAIDSAIVEMTCVPDAVFQVPYCPTGVEVDPAGPGPEPTPIVPNPVRVDIEGAGTVECVRTGPRSCTIEVEFSTQGFESEEEHFFVAATAQPGSGEWQVSDDAAEPVGEEERFVATVEVALPEVQGTEEFSVQVAVLMLPDQASPTTDAPEVLGQTAPEVVYVAEEQTLVPTGEGPGGVEPTPTPTAEPTASPEPTPELTPGPTPSGDPTPDPNSTPPGPSPGSTPVGSPGGEPTPPGPTGVPVPSQTPDPGPTEHPQTTPVPTAAPSPEPTEPPPTPEPTEDPAPTPEATEPPELTPEPTDEPAPSPEPTTDPAPSPDPTETPAPSPEPTEAPPTAEPTPPEATPEPTPPEVTPEPTPPELTPTPIVADPTPTPGGEEPEPTGTPGVVGGFRPAPVAGGGSKPVIFGPAAPRTERRGP
jgi:hypothetical protein